jgi:putative colanic acid biosynthesis acetyltransferase WcaF
MRSGFVDMGIVGKRCEMLSKPMNLAQFSAKTFDRGRPRLVEALWIACRVFAFASCNPFNGMRVAALRLFGARVGRRVVVKPGLKVKFPWRLEIGDECWIGEDCWIDNLAAVTIGRNSCISQGAYLCTGNHDWTKQSFDLLARPIRIGDGVWVAAKAIVAPGVTVGDGAIVTLGTVVTRDVPAGSICRGAQGANYSRASA